MAAKLVIHPLNRGPRQVKLELLLESGRIIKAQAGCTYFWDQAQNLKGKDPLDSLQLTQRSGGQDFISHAVAAARALEELTGVQVPKAAVLIRNLLLGLDIVHGHIMHFYQEILPDYLLFPAAGPFRGGPGDFRIPPAIGEGMLKNMWRAYEIRQLIHRLMALFGGKAPHVGSVVYGGVTRCAGAADILKAVSLLKEIAGFINNQYSTDVAVIEQYYPQYWNAGAGAGNILAVGEFPQTAGSGSLCRAGAVINSRQVELDRGKMTLEIAGSWYEPSAGAKGAFGADLKPVPAKPGGYSWVKGALYMETACEVGALARMTLAGHPALAGLGRRAWSVLGRYRARLEECRVLVDKMAGWLELLDPKGEAAAEAEIPKEGEAIGMAESSRGPVIHYVLVRDKKIALYTVLDALSWNMCPGTGEGRRAPMEQALLGLAVASPDNPVEVYRVARSF